MRTIVVDIDDPNDPGTHTLNALRDVVRPDDRLHFFHHLFHSRLGNHEHDDEVLREARVLLTDARLAQLDNLGTQLTPAPVTTSVAWTEQGWQALLHRATVVNADLVVAKSARRERWQPLAGVKDDWQLIRHSDAPLLLLRKDCAHRYKHILAAIDPLHVDDKPAELDRRILAHAADMARRHSARLSVLNVASPGQTSTSGINMATATPSVARKTIAAHEARVATLTAELDVEVDRVCVIAGVPAKEIVRMAAEENADLVVMGAVARSTLRNLLIGNTAEKVLDRLNADTLVIRPANVLQKISGASHRAPVGGANAAPTKRSSAHD